MITLEELIDFGFEDGARTAQKITVINSINEFVAVCRHLDESKIYEILSTEVSPQVRSKIIDTFGTSETGDSLKTALNALGHAYGCDSLIKVKP